MDQQTVENLLRRLVERVEESERRYGEALEALHGRLDRLAQTTDAARAGSPDQAATIDRLRSQVTGLARRLEQAQEVEPCLDEFLELGKALSGKDFSVASAAEMPPLPGPVQAQDWASGAASYYAPEAKEAIGATSALPWHGVDEADFDKRLVDMAHRLEHSIGAAMPSSEIAGLNARMDEIAAKFDAALSQNPNLEHLQHIERQISEMGQQLGRAELQIARISGIEGQLMRLIERFDEAPKQLEEMASKAANEAARLFTGKADDKPGAAERLEAIHRDLVAMNDRSRGTDDRLADTLAAVHESLKQLVQQVERGQQPQPVPVPPRPPVPQRPKGGGMETPSVPQARPAQPRALAEVSIEKASAPKDGEAQDTSKRRSLRSRLGAAIPDYQESEAPNSFGRSKRGEPAGEAVDLDLAGTPSPSKGRDAEFEFDTTDDLLAAARRAAQAATAQTEERGGPRRAGTPLTSLTSSDEPQGRRKRSLLMLAAALLLVTSAVLLYGRLKSKPEPVLPPQIEESVPAPAASEPSVTPAPVAPAPAPVAPPAHHGTLPGSPGPAATPPERSGESDIPPAVRVSEAPANIALAETPATPTGVTEVAKTPRRPAPRSETSLSPQPVSLKPDQVETLLPGVSVSIQEPSADAKMPAPPATSSTQAVPSQLPMPPEATGSLPLRQAAASGDAKAQYAIALRYAEGEGVAQSWTEAARWLGFAASSGLAPAQYRLAVLIERGQGVAKDAGQAGSWYARAAEQGNIKAMHNLGVAAGEGRSGKPDYAVAAKWYAQAAAYGLADSQFNLAILQEHGLGLDKNLPEAFMWFSLAAANGDAEAAKRRDLVKQELAPAALSHAEQALKAWTAKPASPEANEVVVPASEQADAGSSNKTLIARAQTLLNKLGYDVGVPDGELGDRTRDGIKSFERRNGMTETGEVTVPLVTKLERLTG